MRAATPTFTVAAVALAVAANVSSAADRGRRERLLEPPPEVGRSYERVYPNYPDPCLHYPCYPYRPAPPAAGQQPYPSLQGPGAEAAGADEIGHLIVIVEPVSAEVRLDGVRLQQQPDLSYVARPYWPASTVSTCAPKGTRGSHRRSNLMPVADSCCRYVLSPRRAAIELTQTEDEP